MKPKAILIGTIWTLALAIPFTVLAIIASGQISLNLTAIAIWIADWATATTAIGREWIYEFAERAPELAGMVAGMLVILATLWVARSSDTAEATQKNK
jgi:hypothetical protein